MELIQHGHLGIKSDGHAINVFGITALRTSLHRISGEEIDEVDEWLPS